MTLRPKRKGRKAQIVRDAEDNEVVGLHYRNVKSKRDGRYTDYYCYLEDGKRKWFGRDLRKAVKQYRQWQAEQQGKKVVLYSKPIPNEKVLTFEEAKTIRQNLVETGEKIETDETGAKHRTLDISEADFWEAARDAILGDPQKAAQYIPEIDNLDKLPQQKPSMKLDAVADLYFSRPNKPKHDKNANTNRKYFKEFIRTTQAKTIADLNADCIGHYADIMTKRGRDFSPAWLRSRFSIVNTILSYALQRGKEPEILQGVLVLCKMLKKPESAPANPHPIDREDFHKLYDAADVKWKAILMLSLNMFLKPKALCAVKKEDIDLSTRVFSNLRPKTKEKRVGILWERTVADIDNYQRAQPHGKPELFVANTETMRTQFARLRTQAGVSKDVKYEHIRDGGYTHAFDGTTARKLVAGHAMGIEDAYSQRVATTTIRVLAMVEDHYFPQKKKGKGKEKTA